MLGTGSVKVYELTADLLNKISKKKMKGGSCSSPRRSYCPLIFAVVAEWCTWSGYQDHVMSTGVLYLGEKYHLAIKILGDKYMV